ncbi:MAG: MBL fold metallo-hydrolase, partial [Leptospiraceae bacterium]|nr:MBL fold metallo-hydrolase [Leptospiraceae bacterium]
MIVRLWGVRGSLPTPLSTEEMQGKMLRALEYAREAWQSDAGLGEEAIVSAMPPEPSSVIGGETTCIEVQHDDHLLILDLGTGARKLGLDLNQNRPHIKHLNILLTHTHWDHIQGWPYFAPAYRDDISVHFYSCLEDLPERFVRQQHPDHSNVEFADLPCQTQFHYVEPGDGFEIGPFSIKTKSLIHPGGSISYRIECAGKVFIFATDTEFYGPDLHQQMQEYNRFFHDADLLIMDAQYSLEEAEQKRGWGHTAMTIAVDCSLHWKVKELILTHHEPAHDDVSIWKLFDEAAEYLT